MYPALRVLSDDLARVRSQAASYSPDDSSTSALSDSYGGADTTTGEICNMLSSLPTDPEEPIIARVSCTADGRPYLDWCAENELTLDSTHILAGVLHVTHPVSLNDLNVVYDDVLVSSYLIRLLTLYNLWKRHDLEMLAEVHNVRVVSRDTVPTMFEKLVEHECNRFCGHAIVTFTTLRGLRRPSGAPIARATPPSARRLTPESYLPVVDDTLRRFIIQDWQKTFTTDNLRMYPCAVCARRTPASEIRFIDPGDIDLSVLRNDVLPSLVLPTTYAFELYEHALLYPKGMADPWRLAPLHVCSTCDKDLLVLGVMPKLCLANWLYYGVDCLPPSVSTALAQSTPVDKLLIARARASRICFRFNEASATAHPAPGEPDPVTPEGGSKKASVPQRYVRGNVLVMPQNSTALYASLPPSPSAIRDTLCAVFVGRSKPDRGTIAKLRPVLARKSTVETMLRFLIAYNPYYAADDQAFFGLSRPNLNALFGPGTEDCDCGVLCSMDIGFLEDTEALRASSTGYTARNQDDPCPDGETLLMDNVGYTCGDESPVSYREMKMRALSHCLDGGTFVTSTAGERFVPDFENPALLTWLFPHLDPWGIGSFHHPHRTRVITMEEQLRYLLELDDPRFERDPNFAFVYYNILQKKAVCDSVRFRVKASQQHRIVADLLSIDRNVLDRLIACFQRDPSFEPTSTEERALITLLNDVSTVLHNIPGTTGHKLSLRNEIRALVNFQGTPAFFVTLNPSDVHHPLVRLYAGEDINLEDAAVGEELTAWQRKLIVAKNPGACAKFFHIMITNFIGIILRYGKPERGLFGRCIAYYGTVEAQARGTLHCHMLVWIEGHPNPQHLRDLMLESSEYRLHMFSWLESIIKSELLGTTEPVVEHGGHALPRPPFDEGPGNVHPGVRPPPRVSDMLPSDFRREYSIFVNQLVECYNWHEHTSTCWKYLRPNQTPSDENCRMRIDGSTRRTTELDPETLSIQLRRLHPRIANYNDLVIFLLQANMDVKHIGSGEGAKALIYYITDYITKSSLPAHLGLAALMYAIQITDAKYGRVPEWTSREDTGALTVLVNSMLARNEVSEQEIMSHIIGGGDHYTSHKFRLLYYAAFERILCRYWGELPEGVTVELMDRQPPTTASQGQPLNAAHSAPVSEIDTSGSSLSETEDSAAVGTESTEDEDDCASDTVTLILSNGSISASNQQQDYLLRPTSEPFHSMPLYQFVGLTEKITATAETQRMARRTTAAVRGRPSVGRPQQERGLFMPSHPHHETHLVRGRVVWVVPVLLGPHIARSDGSADELERWSRSVLMLFLPWRSPEDLRRSTETWTDAYARQQHLIPPEHQSIIHNMSVLSQCRDARDRATRDRRAAFAALPCNDAHCAAPTTAPNDDDEPSFELPEIDTDQLSRHLIAPLPPIHQSPQQILDSLVSVPVRLAIDRCYVPNTVEGRGAEYGTAERLTPSLSATVNVEQTYMRALKRKRRPEVLSPPVSLPFLVPSTTHPLPPSVSVTTLAASRAAGQTDPLLPPPLFPHQIDYRAVIEQVIIEYHLLDNVEQLRAFEIVAEHVCFGGSQLRMYIGGVGGTGKSHVVKAILRLFVLLGRRNQILVSAPTGAAAILIGGYTIHSLLLLPHRDNTDLQPLTILWKDVLYLIVDEVSMVSATLMGDISSRLQHAKGSSSIAEDVPFGGVNVIFLGDFGQLSPVSGAPLYSRRYSHKPTVQDTQRKRAIVAFKGVYLWKSVTTVVLLRNNQRQLHDGDYCHLLARVRSGQSGNARLKRTAYDFRTLQTRLLQNFDSETCLRFAQAPFIVGRKNVRDALNNQLVQYHANRVGAEVHNYRSRDTISGQSLSASQQEEVWNLGSSKTHDSPGRLPLFPGMAVMVQENIAFAHNVVNGAVGTVRDIKYEEEDGIRFIVVVYVEIPGAGRLVGQTEDDVIPIFPTATYFPWTPPAASATDNPHSHSVRRYQPPILPAYAYTDYKAQGRSLDAAIIDLHSAMSLQGAYVMLSRVRSMDGVAVLRPFKALKVEERLGEDLRVQLQDLEEIAARTACDYPSRIRR